MKISFLLSPLVAGIFFLSCAGEAKKASSVDSDKIYQRYTSTASEGNDAITVQAEFRVGAYWDRLEEEKTGGDAIELGSPSDITFNGNPLVKDNSVFTGVYYTLTKNGPYEPSQTWLWKDGKGKEYKNVITLNPISFKDIKFYGRDSVRINWSGGPIGENEKVTLRIEGQGRNDKKETSASKTVTDRGAEGVTFGYEMIKDYEGTSVDIYLTRQQLVRLSESNSEGGTLKASYSSKRVSKNIGTRLNSILSL
jgi:hypothetical protein